MTFNLRVLEGIGKKTTTPEAAHLWSQAGFHPIQIKGKRPINKDWQNASRSESRTHRWGNSINVGLRMGLQPSGSRLLVLDDDGGGLALQLTFGELPPTLTLRTGGGGHHYIFTVPAGVPIINRVRIQGFDIDARCDGGQIVVAPSQHASGGHYMISLLTEPVPLPGIYLHLVTKYPEPRPPRLPRPPPLSHATQKMSTVERCERYVMKMEPSNQGEGGSSACLRVARTIFDGFGLDASTGMSVFARWNNSGQANPPWSQRELDRKMQTALTTPTPSSFGWRTRGGLV